MPGDRYTALWLSHSSLSDFIACPRAYFLKNLYRNPESGKKMKLVSPPLSLGQAVHEALEPLALLSVAERFKVPLLERLEESWKKISGKKGGFFNDQTQQQYQERAKDMLARVQNHPGPLQNKAVRLPERLPSVWLSEDENILLCGKIDWLEYFSESDSVHIIDFKTGKNDESTDSLQLPIYYLLVSRLQRRLISKMSYWYLDRSDEPIEQSMPNPIETEKKLLSVALQMKTARSLNHFKCSHGGKGCSHCRPYELLIEGKGEFVGNDEWGNELYAFDPSDRSPEEVIIH